MPLKNRRYTILNTSMEMYLNWRKGQFITSHKATKNRSEENAYLVRGTPNLLTLNLIMMTTPTKY